MVFKVLVGLVFCILAGYLIVSSKEKEIAKEFEATIMQLDADIEEYETILKNQNLSDEEIKLKSRAYAEMIVEIRTGRR